MIDNNILFLAACYLFTGFCVSFFKNIGRMMYYETAIQKLFAYILFWPIVLKIEKGKNEDR